MSGALDIRRMAGMMGLGDRGGIEMKFTDIGFGTTIGERVLLLWSSNGHIEDGVLHLDEDGEIYHVLFDGESFKDEPSHWMPLPEPPED